MFLELSSWIFRKRLNFRCPLFGVAACLPVFVNRLFGCKTSIAKIAKQLAWILFILWIWCSRRKEKRKQKRKKGKEEKKEKDNTIEMDQTAKFLFISVPLTYLWNRWKAVGKDFFKKKPTNQAFHNFVKWFFSSDFLMSLESCFPANCARFV